MTTVKSVTPLVCRRTPDEPVPSLPALGPWAPPAERGLSLECIHRVSIAVDLCEGNKIVKKKFSPEPDGDPSKRKKNPGALATCPVCPLVKTACLAVGCNHVPYKTTEPIEVLFGCGLEWAAEITH